jgi:hypothetical protein
VEKVRGRCEGSGCEGSLSIGNVPIFKALFEGSGDDDEPSVGEPSVGEPAGQLLVSITLGTVELLEFVSETLKIDRWRHGRE